MDVAQLLEPVLSGGIKDTHFFNGRILTADDLRTMQTAARQHDAQLGRAIGDGVAYGLEVSVGSIDSSTGRVALAITDGLAFNALGQAIALRTSIELGLVVGTDEPSVEGGFAVCQPPSPVFTNEGLYILTIFPATGLEGRAPMTEIAVDGVGTRCGSRYEVDAVKFGIVRVTPPASPPANSLFAQFNDAVKALPPGPPPGVEPLATPALSLARNTFAHLCYGSDEIEAATHDPIGRAADPRYGLINRLIDARLLTRCEVPLAAILWQPSGIQILDMWSVRRPIASPTRRRLATGWAMLRQFQDQIDELFRSGLTNLELAAIRARERFRYLPPVGLLPLADGGSRGFTPSAFLFGIPHRVVEFIDGALIEPLQAAALVHEPIDVKDNELVWVYRTWQNAIDQTGALGQPQPCVFFASAHVPYIGLARFDVARWDYANYAAPFGV